METDDTVTRRMKPHILLRIPQWIVATIFALFLMISLFAVGQLTSPGASKVAYQAFRLPPRQDLKSKV